MTSFEYGPVEVFVVEFEGYHADPGVLAAIHELSADGVVRLLDLVIATRHADGTVTSSEVVPTTLEITASDATAGSAAAAGSAAIELGLQGLLGEDDITEAVESLRPGWSIALAAFEMQWATRLAERLTAAKGAVVRSERVPAVAVNQLLRDITAEAVGTGE